MRLITTSAPGKLVLFGEYAVLFGAPAAVAAVDCRAVVTLTERDGDDWEVTAPGLVDGPAVLSPGPGNSVRWGDEAAGGSFGLVEKLFAGMKGAIDLETLPALSMTLDTRSFFESAEGGGAKLGLGSSAALTVALAGALEGWANGETGEGTELRLQRYVDLHRAVQGGAGSGIDVAASALGGVIRFRLSEDRSIAEAEQLRIPETFRQVFVWTGRSASTGDFLGRLDSRRTEAPAEIDPVLDRLGSVSSAGVDALAAGDVDSFLEAVDAFWTVLDRLGEAIDMPILSDDHRNLRRIAEGSGVQYKPSGAGGGDFGIAFAVDGTAADDFGLRAETEGYRVVDLAIDRSGLTYSSS